MGEHETSNGRRDREMVLLALQTRLLDAAGEPVAEQLRALLEVVRDTLGTGEWFLALRDAGEVRIRAALSIRGALRVGDPAPTQGVQSIDFQAPHHDAVRIGTVRPDPLDAEEERILEVVARQAAICVATESRRTMAIEVADVGFAHTNLKTGESEIDERSRQLYGFPPQSTEGTISIHDALSRIHPDDRHVSGEALAGALERGQSDALFEHRLVHEDGTIRWNLVRSKLIVDGDGAAEQLITAGIDITQRKWREEVVARIAKTLLSRTSDRPFEDMAREIADALGSSVVLMAEIDRAASAVRTRALYIDGKPVHLADFPKDVYQGQPPRHAVRLTEQRLRELLPHVRIPRSEPAGFIAVPLVAEAGHALGLAAINATGDVSQDWFAESVLEIVASRAAAELEREQADQEARALAAKVQHAQKLESLGVLAGGIAHDFNNLLTAILGNLGLALPAIPSDSPLHDRLSQAMLASQRAADLTAQMLAYSGRASLQMGPTDPNEVVAEMTSLLGSVISKRARLRVEADDRVGEIEGDASQLGQILMNLVTNASDALGDGDGTIDVRTSVVPCAPTDLLHSWTTREQPHVLIEVRDSGCGMSEPVRNQVFDPFFTTKFTGRGLGMAAVLGIIRQHRGAIDIESSPGVGTCVRLYLPLLEAERVSAGEATPSDASANNRSAFPRKIAERTSGRPSVTIKTFARVAPR